MKNTITLPHRLLLSVEKPMRYLGNELNIVKKEPESVNIRFGLLFPDTYEIGMSNLGMQILYYFINRRPDTHCQRMFAPALDMEKAMRDENIPLFGLESGLAASEFDFLGFTLQYELNYTNVVNMLDLAHVPILAKDRSESDPIIIGGGPCTVNPEPLADVFDLFYLGEGEVSLDAILDTYLTIKENGGSKAEFLEAVLTIPGVYVPGFYKDSYDESGRLLGTSPTNDNVPKTISRVLVKNMDDAFFPETFLVPHIETIHNRVMLEVFRGCIRGCRFCQAGFVYRPARERGVNNLLNQAESLVTSTGHDEISLVSLSTSDYSGFYDLADELTRRYGCMGINVSLPSLRIDAMTMGILEQVQNVRKSSLTFAPEAGSQRLRDVINKNITEDEIISGCELAFNGGWDKLKLYFMLGLPTENQEDLDGIVKLTDRIVESYYKLPKELRKRPISISASGSCFVPKPHTPFQWAKQNDTTTFVEKGMYVKTKVKKQVKFSFHNEKMSVIEGVLARGDRRLGQVIIEAWKQGARFDGWSEHFHYDIWKKAIENSGLTIEEYTRERDYDEVLPWDHLSIGLDKSFLLNEAKKAINGELTPDCATVCSACGIGCAFGEVGQL